jgi:hypothetical protein
MSIKNRDTKQDIHIEMHHSTKTSAQAELMVHGYRPRPEANDLPVKYEKDHYPALTIASDDGRKTWLIVEYPSDAEILALLPDRPENPEKIADRWDTGKHMEPGTLIDLDDKRFKGK